MKITFIEHLRDVVRCELLLLGFGPLAESCPTVIRILAPRILLIAIVLGSTGATFTVIPFQTMPVVETMIHVFGYCMELIGAVIWINLFHKVFYARI